MEVVIPWALYAVATAALCFLSFVMGAYVVGRNMELAIAERDETIRLLVGRQYEPPTMTPLDDPDQDIEEWLDLVSRPPKDRRDDAGNS